MEKEIIFSVISSLIYIIWIFPYWRDVLRKRTIPHPFSSLVWLILVWFNSYVLFIGHEYLAFIPGFISCLFLLLGTIYGIYLFRKIQINWFDYFCLIFSILFLIYYFLFRDITNAVILSALIDFLAFLPTFKKGWLQPWTETILLYFFASISNVFALLALIGTSFQTTLFWAYLVIANLAFFFMVSLRRWYLKWWESVFE